MWTAERGKTGANREESVARIGGVTISQTPMGVYLDGERRNIPIYAPGGYSWRPAIGTSVLVLKTEENRCAVGQVESNEGLEVGEIRIAGPSGNTIYFTEDGQLQLDGELMVNGEDFDTMIARLVEEKLAALLLGASEGEEET